MNMRSRPRIGSWGSFVAGLAWIALTATAQTGAAAAERQAGAIHTRSVGDGARCWVLLHPFGASGAFWGRAAARLAEERGVRVLAPDLPSHGRSAFVSRFDYDLAAVELARALEKSCPKPELIVGASSGGVVALKLGAAVRRPVAVVGVGHAFSSRNVRDLASQSRSLPAGMRTWFEPYLEQGPAQVTSLQRHLGDLARLGERPLLDEEETRRLRRAVLLVHGDRDGFFPLASAEELARSVDGAVLITIMGADHLGPLQAGNSDLTWALMAGFANARSRGSGSSSQRGSLTSHRLEEPARASSGSSDSVTAAAQ